MCTGNHLPSHVWRKMKSPRSVCIVPSTKFPCHEQLMVMSSATDGDVISNWWWCHCAAATSMSMLCLGGVCVVTHFLFSSMTCSTSKIWAWYLHNLNFLTAEAAWQISKTLSLECKGSRVGVGYGMCLPREQGWVTVPVFRNSALDKHSFSKQEVIWELALNSAIFTAQASSKLYNRRQLSCSNTKPQANCTIGDS